MPWCCIRGNDLAVKVVPALSGLGYEAPDRQFFQVCEQRGEEDRARGALTGAHLIDPYD